jgi:hypothetical protein
VVFSLRGVESGVRIVMALVATARGKAYKLNKSYISGHVFLISRVKIGQPDMPYIADFIAFDYP